MNSEAHSGSWQTAAFRQEGRHTQGFAWMGSIFSRVLLTLSQPSCRVSAWHSLGGLQMTLLKSHKANPRWQMEWFVGWTMLVSKLLAKQFNSGLLFSISPSSLGGLFAAFLWTCCSAQLHPCRLTEEMRTRFDAVWLVLCLFTLESSISTSLSNITR